MPIKFKCPDAIEVVSKTTEEQSDLHASTSMASSMRFQVENASKDSKVAASLREMFAQLDKDVPEYLNTDKKVAEYTTIVFTIALKSSYVERDIGRLVALLQEAQLLNLIGVDTPEGTNTFVLDGKTIILVGYSFPRRSRVDKKKLAKLPALLEALTRGLESATIETTPELDTAAVTGADSITLSDEAKEAMENAVKARKEKLSEEEGHKVKANKVPAFKATGAISPALFAALPLGSTAEKADIDASAEASVEAIKALLAASGAAAGGAGAAAAPASGGKKGKGGSGAGPQASGGAAGGSAAASAAASDSGDAGFDIDAVAKAAEGLCISEESDKPAADGKKKEAKLTEDEEKQMKKAMQAVLTAFAGKVFASVQTMAAVAEPSSKGKEVEPRELAVRATKVLFNQEQDKIEEGAALSGAASRAATVYFVGKDNIDSLVGITTFNGDEQALIVRMENVTLDSLFRNMPSTEEGKGMMESVMSSLGCGPSRKAAGEIVKEKRGMCW